jgi:hypothetical protein
VKNPGRTAKHLQRGASCFQVTAATRGKLFSGDGSNALQAVFS